MCTCQSGSVTRASLVRPFFSCQHLMRIPLLSCHVPGTCSNFFQDARRRSADDALWNGRREIHFKGSRFRYLATRGGMALASQTQRHWTFLGSSWYCILGGHSSQVGKTVGSSALQRRAWRAGRLGTEMRQRNSTDPKNRITLLASFDSHCIFTEETPPRRLSAEGRSCITSKRCPCILCWTSTRR